ncbi:hypothetical protein TWF694_000169 [Orbilia ellipsospora]|uniref:Cardiolipin synthase N-terminal domain-containing protein n=1 Tax=Orbilia ellipsospora TaxID=2528407 RepID=A0AAV9XMT8_9PEZI
MSPTLAFFSRRTTLPLATIWCLLLTLFTSLVAGAPTPDITVTTGNQSVDNFMHNNAKAMNIVYAVVAIILVILVIIVWVEVLPSERGIIAKLLWCLFVLVFPIIGVLIYYCCSNRTRYMRRNFRDVSMRQTYPTPQYAGDR